MTQESLAQAGPVTAVAQVRHYGEELLIPVGMSLKDAKDLIDRRAKYLEEDVNIAETFDVFPWDGAHATDIVLTKKFGWSPATATPGFFGPKPPTLINIETGVGQRKAVSWGAFTLPGVQGLMYCAADKREGRVVFKLVATVKRKDEATIRDVFDKVREELRVNSIYRGKAVKIRFTNDDGDTIELPEPIFIETSDIDETHLVYPRNVQRMVDTNLFVPIQRVVDCIKSGISVKRGVLLAGTYGTGKTMAAKVASKLAVQAGVTFIYVAKADELSDAVNFAKQYQSPACVVFCEDIDRAVSGDRSEEMDAILNIIDGIDTKSSNILVVLTTNDVESINPAMLRPGRLDAVIEVTPPDAEAVERLIRIYGAHTIGEHTDLSEVGTLLAGSIPAIIAEVVKRAKLAQLGRQPTGTMVETLTQDSLIEAAQSMKSQIDLLERRMQKAPDKPALESIFAALMDSAIQRYDAEKTDRTLANTRTIVRTVGGGNPR